MRPAGSSGIVTGFPGNRRARSIDFAVSSWTNREWEVARTRGISTERCSLTSFKKVYVLSRRHTCRHACKRKTIAQYNQGLCRFTAISMSHNERNADGRSKIWKTFRRHDAKHSLSARCKTRRIQKLGQITNAYPHTQTHTNDLKTMTTQTLHQGVRSSQGVLRHNTPAIYD